MSHIKGSSKAHPANSADTSALKDHSSIPPKAHITTVAIASSTTTSSSSHSSEAGSDAAVPVPEACTHAPNKDAAAVGMVHGVTVAGLHEGAAATPSALCPVVAFASFAAQLSFKAVLHVVVFGGGLRLGTERMGWMCSATVGFHEARYYVRTGIAHNAAVGMPAEPSQSEGES
jgi:hypothetical protein